MPVLAKSVVVHFIAEADRFLRGTKEAQSGLEKFGRAYTKTVTPIALVTAKVATDAFKAWDAGTDAIIAGTGASGNALKGFQSVMKSVAGQSTLSIGEIGQLVAELNRRTGATGPTLEKMTKKFSDLKRLGVDADVAAITRLFGDWSVATNKQSGTLDKLFGLSQTTGIGVNRLSELMVQFGSPLRQLGLDFDTTAAMFARFEKEGVAIETAMPGLRMALKNFAKAGKEPAPALMETMRAIKGAATTAEANKIAFEIFGVRAGPDLAAAIREGRFDLDKMIASMQNSKGTIDTAAKETLDYADKWKMLQNRLQTVIGPYGEIIGAGAKLLAGLGPTIYGLGRLSSAFKGVNIASKFLSVAPWVLIITATIVAITLLVKNWDKVKRAMLKAWDAIKRAFEAGKETIVGAFRFVVDKFLAYAEWIVRAAATAFGWIPGIGPKLKTAAKKIEQFRDEVNETLGGIKDKEIGVTVKAKIPKKIKGIYTVDIVTGKPLFHSGGVVPGQLGKELLAVVKAGETIRTPEQERQLARPFVPMRAIGMGGDSNVYVSVNVEGSVVRDRELAATVRNVLLKMRSGTTGLGLA